MSELDEEFVKTADQLNAKLAEAAKLLEEVGELADKMGLPTLVAGSYLYESVKYWHPELSREDAQKKAEEIRAKLNHVNVGTLEGAIENLGWSTSSSYC